MRIIIDINGNNINVITEPQQQAGLASPALPSGTRPTPPEILKAAAAIGAHDAGPAPAHLTSPQAVGRPSTQSDSVVIAKAGVAPSRSGKVVKKASAKSSAKSKKR